MWQEHGYGGCVFPIRQHCFGESQMRNQTSSQERSEDRKGICILAAALLAFPIAAILASKPQLKDHHFQLDRGDYQCRKNWTPYRQKTEKIMSGQPKPLLR